MKRGILLIFLMLSLYGCRNNQPIEIYRMSNLDDYQYIEYYVIYNHRGKTKNELINSVIEYNRATISLDTMLKYVFYCRMFFKQDRILTKDYKEGGEDAIFDHAEKCFVDIAWDNRYGSDTTSYVYYTIAGEESTSYKEYCWKSKNQLDSLLNPIPRR